MRSLISGILLLSASGAQAQEQDTTTLQANQQGPRAPIEVDEWLSSFPPTLGSASLSVAKGRGQRDGGYYYLPPYFQYDIARFRKKVEDECNLDATSSKVVYLPARFAARNVIQEVAASIGNIDLSKIRPYPYGLIRIITGGYNIGNSTPSKTRLVLPPGAFDTITNGYVAAVTNFDTNEHQIPIADSCTNLRRIAQHTGDVHAFIYTQMPNTRTNFFSVELGHALEALSKSELIQSQQSTGSVQVIAKAQSGGAGLNLGGFFGGTSSSRDVSEVKDRRGRWVSSNLIQEAMRDHVTTLNIFRLSEANNLGRDGADTASRDTLRGEFEKKVTDFVLNQAPSVVAAFQKVDDNQWKIIETRLDSALLNKSQVEELLKTSTKPELNGTNKVSGKYSGVEGSVDQTAKITDDRGIEWQQKDGGWVPVSAKLYFFNQTDLKSRIYATVDDVELTGGALMQRLGLVNVSNGFSAPDKRVVKLAGGLYKTIAHWGGGAQELLCISDPVPTGGHTRIGATETRRYGPGNPIKLSEMKLWRGCATAPYCDSAGESCESFHRTEGCFINNEWLIWYRDRQNSSGLIERQDDICALPSNNGGL